MARRRERNPTGPNWFGQNEPRGAGQGQKPPPRFNFWYVTLALLALLLFQSFWAAWNAPPQIPYSEFLEHLEAGRVQEVVVSENFIQGTLAAPAADGAAEFVTRRVEPDLAAALEQQGVDVVVGTTEQTWFATMLSWVLPVLLFVGLWYLLMRRLASRAGGAGGGLMSIGRSKARIYMESDTKTSFADVAGVDEAKAELQEIVDFLKDRQSYGRLGARLPKGILLVGPPGTGKTLLARAVAGEAGVPFFSISGSEFVEMFVGVGASRVRDLFQQAREKAPAIIFIDELDALGRARGAYMGGGHDEKETTLNQLLVEMDGFDPREGLILLGATNRPEILDPALLRAGRFDRQVLVDRPDKAGRIQILNVHLKGRILADDVDPGQVAALTPGFTGADLANLVNEAALLATRRGADAIHMQDFTAAIERIIAGLEKRNRLLNPFERKVVAHHEMGHALVAMGLKGSDPVHKVSIIPRGVGALGYTIQRPTEDRFLMTREELENKMAVLLGGRAAEKLIFDHLSTGASDDLARVTDIARSMVMRYGMHPELGHVALETERQNFLGNMPMPSERRYSDDTARAVDAAVKEIVDRAFDRACDTLDANRAALETGAQWLLEKETLDEDDLRRLLAETPSALEPDAANIGDPDAPALGERTVHAGKGR